MIRSATVRGFRRVRNQRDQRGSHRHRLVTWHVCATSLPIATQPAISGPRSRYAARSSPKSRGAFAPRHARSGPTPPDVDGSEDRANRPGSLQGHVTQRESHRAPVGFDPPYLHHLRGSCGCLFRFRVRSLCPFSAQAVQEANGLPDRLRGEMGVPHGHLNRLMSHQFRHGSQVHTGHH